MALSANTRRSRSPFKFARFSRSSVCFARADSPAAQQLYRTEADPNATVDNITSALPEATSPKEVRAAQRVGDAKPPE
jgi:hypothetical protein